jgi:hypothetical protein
MLRIVTPSIRVSTQWRSRGFVMALVNMMIGSSSRGVPTLITKTPPSQSQLGKSLRSILRLRLILKWIKYNKPCSIY